ncbi:MAG: hypothetical protein AVDCRST_MAG48-1104, partial [uncultured Friedmanniella sp.]
GRGRRALPRRRHRPGGDHGHRGTRGDRHRPACRRRRGRSRSSRPSV